MRQKVAALLAVAAVMAAFTPARGGAAEPRTASLRYAATDDNFIVGGPAEELVVGTGSDDAQYDFTIEKGERYVSAVIVDDAESNVAGIVTQWKKVDEQSAGPAYTATYHAVVYERFCNYTPEPVRIKPKLDVRIIVHEGTCMDGTVSAPTSGDITLDFHRKL